MQATYGSTRSWASDIIRDKAEKMDDQKLSKLEKAIINNFEG